MRVDFLFFSLIFVCFGFISARKCFVPPSHRAFRLMLSFGYRFGALMKQKAEESANGTLHLSYWHPTRCLIHTFECEWALHLLYSGCKLVFHLYDNDSLK